ncbi:MAG: hypothetical protein FJW14_08155 [Acidimicrobiia bacterium]|nr:hypothetical protein [Acidimicrobiia bacterium]
MRERTVVGILTAAVLAGGALLGAQGVRPLAPVPPEGQRVAPFFDGWYENPDGTVTLSFGYSNSNRTDTIEIPLGADNFITPKEYDGRQPTSFPPVVAEQPETSSVNARDRERGVFTVTLPKASADVVWTLRYRAQSFSVPGRAKLNAYQLRWPMAMGSIPPLLRFSEAGAAGRGPAGIEATPVKTPVGKPVPLAIWVTDDSVREQDPVTVAPKGKPRPALNVNWYKHSGPGPVRFSSARQPIAQLEAMASTEATFAQPGTYVLRVRADNFGRLDTSPGNQCCWTNGYVRVTVTP